MNNNLKIATLFDRTNNFCISVELFDTKYANSHLIPTNTLPNLTRLAGLIKDVYPIFAQEEFIKTVLGKFSDLELKQRISRITKNLKNFIPEAYIATTNLLLASLETIPEQSDFIFAAFSEFVQVYGCKQEYLTISLTALVLNDFVSQHNEIPSKICSKIYKKQSLDIMNRWNY